MAARSATHPKSPAAPERASSAVVAQRLAEADRRCAARGSQLTALRREVYELLLLRNGVAKAYDLQDDLSARRGRVAPTTVYRALDFLIEQELVHRVDAVNSFVACNGGGDGDHTHHHAALMAVCGRCGAIAELHDHAGLASIEARLRVELPGFHQAGIEIKGVCGDCLGGTADAPRP